MEGLLAIVLLNDKPCEVGGETFAQPKVRPSGLRNGIAEPLVSNFVRGHFFQPATDIESTAHLSVLALLEEIAGEDNRAGVFHPAELCRADDQRQFLVRIRRDTFAKERERVR